MGGHISITFSDLAKYPFLPQARKYIANLDLDFKAIANLPRIRERAKQRVSAVFKLASAISQEPSKLYETEIASYALALLYVAAIRDPSLRERFALFEAQKINAYLKTERNSDVIFEIAKAFNWEVHASEDGSISVHFTNFLKASTKGRLFHDPKWKLVNRALEKGWVRVSPFELARLLQEEVQKQIEDSTMLELRTVPEELQRDINELKTEFLKIKPQFEEIIQVIRAQESDYPPCISELMKRTSKGQHLSHIERFTLVTYLLHQGIRVDTIVSLFSNITDFKEDKTRYQVEHLAGERWGRTKPYITYNCASLQTHGICSKPADPICRTIRNPLTYHLRKKGWKKVREP